MNSFPVLLLPVGEQVDVLGAGGRPPGTDETAVGGEAFLELLQQMLLGGAVQIPSMAHAPIAGGDSDEPGEAVLFGTRVSMGVSGVLPDMAVSMEQPRNPASGGTAQPVVSVGSGVEQPPGLNPAGGPPAENASPAPAPLQVPPLASGLDVEVPVPGHSLPSGSEGRQGVEHLRVGSEKSVTAPVSLPDSVTPAVLRAGLTSGLAQEGGNDGELSKLTPDGKIPIPVADGKTPIPAPDGKTPGRSTVAAVNQSASPTIPVSLKEGDVPPSRVQETAPAAVEEDPGDDPVHRMVRLLRHATPYADVQSAEGGAGAKATAAGKPIQVPAEVRLEEGQPAVSREGGGQTIKPVPVGNPSSQEGAPGDNTGHRNSFLSAPPEALTPKGEFSRVAEVQGRIPTIHSPLPPDTAQSVMNQVMKGFSLQVNGQSSEFRVKLEPESLGEVVLHVRMENGRMQAQIDVTQAGVKAVLENNLPQLRLSLSQRGIDVQRLDVSTGGERPANESGGNADRQSRHGFRRDAGAEGIEQYLTGRLLGYNTIEMVM